MTNIAATSAGAFEALYSGAQDPWQFATSDYERNRYATILAGLRRRYYGTAFEPGCSIGELTAQLATRCAEVLASDFAPTAVAHARERCKALPNVEIRCADLANQIPQGPFDLIVFSEIGYYFEESTLRRILNALSDRLIAGGELIAVHWLGRSQDHVLHGDRVHEILLAELPLTWVAGSRHTGFRVDSWEKRIHGT